MKINISPHGKRKKCSVLTYCSEGETLSDAEHALLQACLGPCSSQVAFTITKSEFAVVTVEVLNRDLPARVRTLVAHGFSIQIR